MIANEGILARIKELKSAVADGVVAAEIRSRSYRVSQLQDKLARMCALIEARATMYGGQMGEWRYLEVNDLNEEKKARADGFHEKERPIAPVAAPKEGEPTVPTERPEFPKVMYHPGFPNGGATGMLVKDYRGKDANQEVWKFDAALVNEINKTMKQAAIEEGQWTENHHLEAKLQVSKFKGSMAELLGMFRDMTVSSPIQ